MKHPAPVPAEPQRPPSKLPTWVLIPLGLLLLLLSVGCSREKLASILPKSMNPIQSAKPLSEVLPGRWDIQSDKGGHVVLQFGRHSEMSFVMDLPPELRQRFKLEQLWMGGNYRVNGNGSLDVTMTDGRWATALAEMRGLKLQHLGIISYTDDTVVDSDHDTWKRVGNQATAHEVRDIADDPPPAGRATASAPPTATTSTASQPAENAAGAAAPHRLQAERERLAAVFAKLEKRRKSLDSKDARQLAAFNKDAADYTRQVARFAERQTAPVPGRRGPVAVEGVVGGNPAGPVVAPDAARTTAR